MAERYRDNAVIWGFDLANEPVEEELGDGCDDWQSLATRAARAIRAVNSRQAIIVEPSPWGSAASIRNLDPLPVEGVVYSVHMYEPSAFTHQGIHGNAAGVRYPGLIGKVQQDKATLRAVLQPVRDFQRRHNVHIYVGEFSAIRWAPGAVDYLRDCIELFEEYGWDWTCHALYAEHKELLDAFVGLFRLRVAIACRLLQRQVTNADPALLDRNHRPGLQLAPGLLKHASQQLCQSLGLKTFDKHADY